MWLRGFQVTVGKLEPGLWTDDDKPERYGWGMKLCFVAGNLLRPVPKFWRYKFNAGWENNPNVWNNPDDVWFIIKLSFVFGLFLSVAYERFGFYIGLKPDNSKGLIPSIRLTFRRRFSV